MPEITQTTNSYMGADKVAAALQELNSKLQGISGVATSLNKGISDIEDILANPKSGFFTGMTGILDASLKTAFADANNARRNDELAKEQHKEALRRSGAEPVRGQSDFWAQAYSPVSRSPVETQAEALKATFRDTGVQQLLKDTLSSATIRSAVNSDVDDRTAGQKVLDQLTFGLSKGIRGITDYWGAGARAQRAEEKATKKDQGTIKREKKQVDQLSAQYRKLKADNEDGRNDKKLQKVLEELQERTQVIKAAEKRIDDRKADPYQDLVEMGDAINRPEIVKKTGTPVAMNLMDSTGVGGSTVSMRNGTQPMQRNSQMFMPQGITLPIPVKIMESLESKVSTVPTERVTSSLGDDRVRTRDVTGDKEEPVEMGKRTAAGENTEARDEREAHDIQRYLDTRLRPEFYQEGTKFFKKGNSGELFEGMKSSEDDGGSLLSKMGKGGLYAALGAATVAAGAKIAQAGMLAYEWMKTSEESAKRRQEIYDQGIAANEKKKKGWNDDAREATTKSMRAEKELDETKGGFWNKLEHAVAGKGSALNGIYTAVVGKTAIDAAQEKADEAELDRKLAIRKQNVKVKAAREAGIDVNDTEKMNRFSKEYEANKRRRVVANANPGMQPMQETVATPAAKVDTGKVVTGEEQAKRLEEAMYNGTKRALMDKDVQDRNEQNARKQGEAIQESLVGRK